MLDFNDILEASKLLDIKFDKFSIDDLITGINI